MNIKKGEVTGYTHNAPTIRDMSAEAACNATNNLKNAPEAKSGKATKFIVGGHNAPALMRSSGKSVKSLFAS